MNEDDQNLQPWIEPELEARVVAWVLGEASAFEIAELERLVSESPELAIFKRRIESVHGLVASASRAEKPSLRLSPDRRRKLLDAMAAPKSAAAPKVRLLQGPRPAWLTARTFARVAASLMIGAIVVTFVSSLATFRSSRHSVADSTRADGGGESLQGLAMTRVRESAAMEKLSLSPASERPVAKAMPVDLSTVEASTAARGSAQATGGSTVLSAASPSLVGAAPAQMKSEAMRTSFPASQTTMVPATPVFDDFSNESAKPTEPLMALAAVKDGSPASAPTSAIDASKMIEGEDFAMTASRRSEFQNVETKEAINENATLAIDGISVPVGGSSVGKDSDPMFKQRQKAQADRKRSPASNGGPSGVIDLDGAPKVAAASGVLSDPPLGNLSKKPAASRREEESSAAGQPFSTFSLHVADVSFQLAKDALERGGMPDAAQIRPEEFYNAFDYGDPAPAAGEEVACRIEQSAHPFAQQRNLVRIAMKVASTGRAASQPLRLTILLDTSGSMEREDRAVSVRKALASLASLLGPKDRVTLIGFARQPRLLAENVTGDRAGTVVDLAARTPSEGGTNLEEALGLATQLARKHFLESAQNRIVLLTDGAANLGNAIPGQLAARVVKMRQEGIAFDACGVGADGLNDEVLESLTRQGDGRYYLINQPADADASFARQLAGAFRPAAENVKVQVRFNPQRVGKYKLIGFEQHRLQKEDFRNDRVDAAELSAEEAAVALYQVEPLPDGEGELGEVFIRFRDPVNGAMVERSWTLPYDERVPAFDQASPSMQLAIASAMLAEKLRGDSSMDLATLAPVVNTLRSHYAQQTRVRQLVRMFEQLTR